MYARLASSDDANNSTSASVGELQKATGPVSTRKRESTNGEGDGPSKKKTACGIYLILILIFKGPLWLGSTVRCSYRYRLP